MLDLQQFRTNLIFFFENKILILEQKIRIYTSTEKLGLFELNLHLYMSVTLELKVTVMVCIQRLATF